MTTVLRTPHRRLVPPEMPDESRERQRAYKRKYAEANREKERARRLAHYHANKTTINERRRNMSPEEREHVRARDRAWAAGRKERRAQQSKEWRQANPDKRRAAKRKYLYGVSQDEYDRRFAAQGGCCAICGAPPEEGGVLAVDHDHESDAVRDLLCRLCNMGLGSARDSIAVLERMIAYLKRHSEVRLSVAS